MKEGTYIHAIGDGASWIAEQVKLKFCNRSGYLIDFFIYGNISQKHLSKGLPIGSGEIESSHRHVVQKRLKIAGAWWKTENANGMLNLRIDRLNGAWECYWESQRKAA